MLAVGTSLHGLGETHAPLPAAMAVLVGLGALALVTLDEIWQVVRHLSTIAHEGAHALAGSSVGHKVVSITLKKKDAEGLTKTNGRGGGAPIVIAFVGYLGPSGFGLLAAKLLSLGYINAVLWIAVVGLAILLPVLKEPFSFVSVIVAGGLLLFVAAYTNAGVETVVAYGLTWFLLLSGVRVLLVHRAKAGDANNLRKMTHVPQVLWAAMWLFGAIAALGLGGSLLL